MSNLLGFHFVDSVYSEAQVAQHMDLLRATKPAWINVLGGAQYDQALAFAKLVRRDVPETRVIFRHFKDGGDDGMHTRLSADEWWQKIGSLYVGSDLTILTDNESGADDLTYYADWHARAMTMAAQHGVSLAVGRFSVLNPPDSQWPQLDPMWRALDRFWALHIWSPNVYFSDDNLDGLNHIFHGWWRCNDLTIKTPRTVIGEFAYAKNLDPHKGYIAARIDGGVYAQKLIDLHGNTFQAVDVAACIYSIGEWPIGENTFGLDSAALTVLRNRASPPTTPPPPPVPKLPAANDPRWQLVTITTDKAGVNMRDLPTTVGSTIIHSMKGTLAAFVIGDTSTQSGDWRAIKAAGYVGWVHTGYFAVVTPPPSTPPPPSPTYVTREEVQAMLASYVPRTEYERVLALLRDQSLAFADGLDSIHPSTKLQEKTA